MVNRLLLRKLLRDLWDRRGGLLALVLILMVGVGCFVAFAAVYQDLDGSRARYYRNQRLAHLTVDLKRAPRWVVDQVAQLPGVREARGRINFGVLIQLEGQVEPVTGVALGMPAMRRPVLNDVLLRSGCWFSGSDQEEVIVNEAFAAAHGLTPGSRIHVLLLEKQYDLLVVGTAMSPEFVYCIPPGGGFAPEPERFGVLYLEESFIEKACNLDGAVNQLLAQVHDRRDIVVDNILRTIEQQLDAYGVTGTTPAREQPSVRFLADELQGLRISSRVMPVIFLGVAALILNVVVGRMVVQQRAIIGTLKALGYSSGSVMIHYLTYGVVVGVVGGVLGGGLGGVLQLGLVHLYGLFYALPDITAHIYPGIFLSGVLISVLFAAAGTIRAVRRGARLPPAEAMRPAPPERGGRVLPERVPALWSLLPFGVRHILRGIFRNPYRSTLGVLASLISTALIVSALSSVDALDHLLEHEFARLSRESVRVTLRDPAGRQALTEVGHLPAISYAEAQLGIPCDISNGSLRRRTGVTGLVPGSILYAPLDSEGHPIAVPPEGLLMSHKLAELLGARPGDTLRLRPLLGRRETVTAPLVGTVESYLGLMCFANLEYLSRLLGEEWCANTILGSSLEGSPSPAFYGEAQERPVVVGLGDRLQTLTRMRQTFGEFMGLSIGIMVLFAGLIAFGSVLNAALVSLSEREREVATLRVLGYTPLQITGLFAGESILQAGLGICIGLGAGVGLSHLMAMAYDTELYRFPAVIRGERLLQSALCMVLFVSVAQGIIHHLIKGLPWREVLKHKE